MNTVLPLFIDRWRQLIGMKKSDARLYSTLGLPISIPFSPADCPFVHSSAYGQWGDVMLELVQQESSGASPFRDLFEAHQTGIVGTKLTYKMELQTPF